MVNGEWLRSQRIIGLPFTVHCLPNDLLSALSFLEITPFRPVKFPRGNPIQPGQGRAVVCRDWTVLRFQ